MSKKIRGSLSVSIESISPVANVLNFPSVAELFAVIERIVVLIGTARYYREALHYYYMREYMLEVKQTIRDNSGTINDEYTPSLMKALENWDKFLIQYPKPISPTFIIYLLTNIIDYHSTGQERERSTNTMTFAGRKRVLRCRIMLFSSKLLS